MTGYLFFGTDFPTKNGTGIRDYIHLTGLTDAHIEALDYLRQSGQSTLLNCSYGHGYSVREVIQTVNEVHGQPLTVEENRDDLAIHQNWLPRYDGLHEIVRTSLAWERRLPDS